MFDAYNLDSCMVRTKHVVTCDAARYSQTIDKTVHIIFSVAINS